jgi:hypothetical protein
MAITKDAFRRIYVKKSRELTGNNPPVPEIEENFSYYSALVDLCGRDGSLSFSADKDNRLTWNFEPA